MARARLKGVEQTPPGVSDSGLRFSQDEAQGLAGQDQKIDQTYTLHFSSDARPAASRSNVVVDHWRKVTTGAFVQNLPMQRRDQIDSSVPYALYLHDVDALEFREEGM